MASRAVLAIVMALAVAAPDVNADGVYLRHHHPNILERIMEPFVHEFERSKLGGPAKQSLRNDHSEVVNKLNVEPFVEPLFVQGFGLPSVAEKGSKHAVVGKKEVIEPHRKEVVEPRSVSEHKVESKKVVIESDSGSDHKVEGKKVVVESDSGSDHKVEGKKVVVESDSGSDHKVEGRKVVVEPGSGSVHKVERKKVVVGPDSGSKPKTIMVLKNILDVSSSSSSDLVEPPSPVPRLGSGRRNVDLMQYFWNNLMAAPRVMHPKVALMPQKPVFGRNGERMARTVVFKRGGRNGSGVQREQGVVSMDVQVFVFPNSSAIAKRNAADARANGALSQMAAMESQMSGLMSRLFPGAGSVLEVPRNRSAYSVVDVFPAQDWEFEEVLVPNSFPSDYASMVASSDAYASSAFTKITLLLLLMTVACCISCILGSTLPFSVKKNRTRRAPSVWVTKTGKLLRLRGPPQDRSNALPLTHITGPWRA
ncbi:uncharacterized protein LOC142774204 [Rhipicephalus microplus]|uniref:uncharacterized protein LOC142774204 n=1 Tax=Rhipicephalus microplus TaxID=6941 RepID=UPI003F6D4DA3